MSKKRDKTTTVQQLQKTLHKNMSFASSEAYKTLRANIQFVLPKEEGNNCRIIGVTSAMVGEGKSTTAINLSYVLAESGKRVLLIDGDMRRPSIGKKLNIKNSPGLSNLLVSSEKETQIAIQRSMVLDNWFLLTAGDIPPTPSELLGSKRMNSALKILAAEFDYIVVDLPPVNVVSDALVASSWLDGMLIVVRENYATRREVSACIRQLNLAEIKILGVVMHCVKDESKPFKKYKSYDKYSKYYAKSDKETGEVN